ncbi:MAG: hemerythrin domain-containing protein [Candidatus Coatesbacteria bacterium]
MTQTALTESSAVSSFVEAYPAAVAALIRLDIDFCGQGDRPLNSLCAELGLDAAATMRELTSGDEAGEGTENDWHALSNTGMVDYLVATHHRHLKRELPRLQGIMDAVAHALAAGHPDVRELDLVFSGLHKEINEHLYKEEEILFPAIRTVDSGRVPPMRAPLLVMLEEHYHASEALRRMRRLTAGYAPPPDASRHHRALLKGLEALEYDLRLHIHKENNVLFPRIFSAVERIEAGTPPPYRPQNSPADSSAGSP